MTRRTTGRAVSVAGIGLHLGEPCTLTFVPAESGKGISFRRVDLPGKPLIRASLNEVASTERRTHLGDQKGDRAVHTVEHVLAAVVALGIDDLTIDIDGPEPPILDGSAEPFFQALKGAGTRANGTEADVLTLGEPVRIIDGDSVYEAYPADRLTLDVTIDFDHPLIGRQQGVYEADAAAFERELGPARTFGFVHEVDSLRAKGLIKGASTANAVVLDETGLVDATLRWKDEFVRHKALDIMGDLALAGARVRARIVAIRPSHRGTVTLVREIVKVATKNAAKGATKVASKEKRVYTVEEIMKVLPHRYPFLLVDRILEVDEKRIVGLKNVTMNEPFFQGHFPGHPIMPGVLIVEAMAQVGGMLLMGPIEVPDSKVVYFMSLDNVKFRKPVRPGDQIIFEVEIAQVRGTVCKMHGVGRVDGEVVVEADMAAMVRDR
ncbi:MAG TPA: bifunctional UDP-3-O-[3-hydroxymyristoyl] N-acetylglucosamine deacetylase/3-hydroxyacyl-ACP dehydratase [Gemmatimonadaceae bacterium]|nr:bifunctional UDP-3-O-[3-hydroxymyristoyl] N-acetylglucosamine deacetylase/3-hydroxyacyl-ACP dehydratase [Gemmatimonadaceae bacterium]